MFEPTTNVRVLQNVDCDPTGNNVLSFNSVDEETNYYISKTKFDYPTCRVEGVHGFVGTIILPGTPDKYYDCNYIMWNNAQFTRKWFYAYLNNVEPYGYGASVATYVIDNFRTWYWEWSLSQCLVARENVNDDTIGRWLLPENIEAGEYVCNENGNVLESVDMTPKLVVVYSWSPADESTNDIYSVPVVGDAIGTITYNFAGLKPVYAGGMVCEGIYQGARFLAFNCDSISDRETIDEYIKSLVGEGQINKIITMFMAPAFAVTHATAIPVDTFTPFSVDVGNIQSPSSFGDYVPKNNKLFTQQYNFLVINNNMGVQTEYGYEYFNEDTAKFKAYAALSQGPSIRLVPLNYKGVEENNLYQVDLSGFPRSSYSYSQLNQDVNANRWSTTASAIGDVYGNVKNILGAINQKRNANANMLLSSVEGAVGGAAGGVAGAAIGAVSGGISSASSVSSSGNQLLSSIIDAAGDVGTAIAEYHDKRRIPNVVQGTADGNITFSMKKMTFDFYKMQIQPQFAKKVDDYLSAYGYRIDEFKVPNLTGRKNWNYVQLIDPVIKGNLPYIVKVDLYNQFSKGVRIWHNPSNFMNFSVDNSIIGG